MSSVPIIYVTGCSGAVGAAVLKELKKLTEKFTFKVRAQIRNPKNESKVKEIFSSSEISLVDLMDYNALMKELNNVTVAFLVTPYTHDQTVMARLFVEACVENNVSHIVHLGVPQPPHTLCSYGSWHLFTETFIESQSNLNWTHLRPNMFFENLIEYGGIKNLKGSTLTFPIKPDIKGAWVAVEDVGAVTAAILVEPSKYDKQILGITSELTTINDIVKNFSVASSKEISIVTNSLDEAYKALIEAGNDQAYMKGFYQSSKETNSSPNNDATNYEGAKEGLEVVKKLTGREPIDSQKFAEKHKIKIIQA